VNNEEWGKQIVKHHAPIMRMEIGLANCKSFGSHVL